MTKYCLAAATLALALTIPTASKAAQKSVSSPNQRITLHINTDKELLYSISLDGQTLMQDSKIGLELQGGKSVGCSSEGKKLSASFSKIQLHKEHIVSPLYRFSEFAITYNQMDVKLQDGWSVSFRVFDEGVAYRFNQSKKEGTIIVNEVAEFNFPGDPTAWLAYSTNKERPFAMAFQNQYEVTPISDASTTPAFLPSTVDCNIAKITILQSDLEAYPGMFLTPIKSDTYNQSEGNTNKTTGLKGIFAPYPAKMDYYRWRNMNYVAQTEDYIARSQGARSYPWRVLAITERDTQMPVNNLVYALASPNRVGDISWIRPGKVAWDWWSDWNIRGVDFVAGINMPTYKYYIDFAAQQGLEYIVLDEGWYDTPKGKILETIPEIDLPELVRYGNEKEVGIVLWTVFNTLDSNLEEACRLYSQMGIKGFKVDFLDRDDQTAVEMTYRIAQTAAKYHLLLDYHGYYSPTGINRTYPNILNFEGVFGMEEVRWATDSTDMPLYDVTFPFIRLMAGPVDYTPGAMRNGTKATWKAIYNEPISMGTRAHQAASYIVHDAPFIMLADTPTSYMLEPEYTSFIASLPVTCQATFVTNGEIGKYIVTARKYEEGFYGIGGLTNWDERDITLDLDFLPQGKEFEAELLTDGVNANHNAMDFKLSLQKWTRDSRPTIHLASGGGFAIKLKEKR